MIMNGATLKNTETIIVSCLKPGTIAGSMRMIITTIVASHLVRVAEAVTKENARLIINHIIQTRYVQFKTPGTWL